LQSAKSQFPVVIDLTVYVVVLKYIKNETLSKMLKDKERTYKDD
jgi:transposase-like protein